MDNYILFILASLVAGEVWNNVGYFSEWVNNRNNPQWTGFDKTKLRNDLLLGLLLGFGIVIYQALVAGTQLAITIPTITNSQTFIAAVGALFGVVAIVDKAIVGGIGKAVSMALSKPKKA